MKLQLPRPKYDDIGLNLTPLIDVVFLLLIFLLVTTTFTRQTYLELELPTLQADQAVPEAPIELWIQANGSLWVAGQLWDQPQIPLQQVLAQQLALYPNSDVMILVDPAAPSQAVLDVLSAMGQLGQTRVIFSGAERVEE